MSSDDLVAVIHSMALRRGLGAGYALVIKPTKIVGAKKFTQEHYFAYMLTLDQAGKTAAQKVAAEIEKDKQFELTGDQILSVEIKDPGRFTGGHIAFKTPQEEIKISVSGTFGTGSGNILDVLTKLFNDVAPGKVHRAGK